MLAGPDIKRREDGSIDIGHYARGAAMLRREAMAKTNPAMLSWLREILARVGRSGRQGILAPRKG